MLYFMVGGVGSRRLRAFTSSALPIFKGLRPFQTKVCGHVVL